MLFQLSIVQHEILLDVTPELEEYGYWRGTRWFLREWSMWYVVDNAEAFNLENLSYHCPTQTGQNKLLFPANTGGQSVSEVLFTHISYHQKHICPMSLVWHQVLLSLPWNGFSWIVSKSYGSSPGCWCPIVSRERGIIRIAIVEVSKCDERCLDIAFERAQSSRKVDV